jgi:DNA repair protein RadD
MSSSRKAEFLSKLRATLEKRNVKSVGNSALIEALGWTKDEFFEVKSELLREGRVVRGRGRGGSIGLGSASTQVPISDAQAQLDLFSAQNSLDFEPGETVSDLVATDGSRFVFNADETQVYDELINMNHDVLKGLLPEGHANTVRAIVYGERGARGRTSKEDLVSALISIYGYDLLSQSAIRSEIARHKEISQKFVPTNWRAGSTSAISFVDLICFPRSFAGDPGEKPSAIEYFPKKINDKPLFDFQKKGAGEVLKRLVANKKALLTMPTGTGKTKTSVEIIRKWFEEIAKKDQKTVIWVAHTEELLEQFICAIRESFQALPAHYDVEVLRSWSTYKTHHQDVDEEFQIAFNSSALTDEQSYKIVVSTTQSLDSLIQHEQSYKWFSSGLKNGEVLLIIDEAHRSAAPSYLEIINAVGECCSSEPYLLGLTATPRRNAGAADEVAATAELLEVFGGISSVVDPFADTNELEGIQMVSEDRGDWDFRQYLIQRGILAAPKFVEILTGWKMDRTAAGELINEISRSEEPEHVIEIDKKLSAQLSNNKRRLLLIKHLKQLATNGKTIYFAPTREDAELVAWLLRREGIRAASVQSNTKMRTRRRIIENFRSGDLQILCNAELLTTGFDDPQVKNIAIARATISTVLYEQMIGRGLRGELLGGTKSCEIVFFKDDLPDFIESRLAHYKIRERWRIQNNQAVVYTPRRRNVARTTTFKLEDVEAWLSIVTSSRIRHTPFEKSIILNAERWVVLHKSNNDPVRLDEQITKLKKLAAELKESKAA